MDAVSEAGSEARPSTTDSDSEPGTSQDEQNDCSAASDGSHQPQDDPNRDPAGLARRRPAQQQVKGSMPLWREARWGSDRVNSRTLGSSVGVPADDGSSENGASGSNGAAGERLPWRRPSSGEGGARSPRPVAQRDPFVRRGSQNGASSSQAAWEPGGSRRGSNPSRQNGVQENSIPRREWAVRPNQKPALGELAAADRASSGNRASLSGSSEPSQDSPRQQQHAEGRQRRQYGSEDRTTAPEQRRPARRNPGIPWEAKIVGHKGVPLLFVLPEDEQQGAGQKGITEGPLARCG